MEDIMRISVYLEDDLINEAKELTKIENTQKLIQHAVKSMKEYEALKEFLKLGGTQPNLRLTPRRILVVDD